MSTPEQIRNRESYAGWRRVSQELDKYGLSTEQKKSVMLLMFRVLDNCSAFGSIQKADWSSESLKQFFMDEGLKASGQKGDQQ